VSVRDRSQSSNSRSQSLTIEASHPTHEAKLPRKQKDNPFELPRVGRFVNQLLCKVFIISGELPAKSFWYPFGRKVVVGLLPTYLPTYLLPRLNLKTKDYLKNLTKVYSKTRNLARCCAQPKSKVMVCAKVCYITRRI